MEMWGGCAVAHVFGMACSRQRWARRSRYGRNALLLRVPKSCASPSAYLLLRFPASASKPEGFRTAAVTAGFNLIYSF